MRRIQFSNIMDYNITRQLKQGGINTFGDYDVFLSFRGADTRVSFVSHLYNSLLQGGINTFGDYDVLEKGDIPRDIFEAIEKSRISIVIFSENYASSTRCLDELAKILECKKSQQQFVLPIFYRVDPSDVRNQRGTFGEAFVEHESRFKDDLNKVKGWREALTHAANLGAWDLNNYWLEAKFIREIIEVISQLLNRAYLRYETNNLVGIDSRIREMRDLLGVGGADVRMGGIWGMGGMGKTTLGKAVYNLVAHRFEGSCFLGNVRENSKAPGGLVQLQKDLLHDILGLKIWSLTNVDSGVNIIKGRLRHKRVLLIIDDVDQLDQLKYLAGSSDWFGAGSRIIITARDKQLLHAHKVDFTYKVKPLEPDEAMELFHSKAFPTSRIPNNYLELANRVVGYAQRYPLALTAMGSLLYGKSIDEWHSILERYERAPASDIREILKITEKELDLQSTELNEVGSFEMPEADESEADDVDGTIGIQGQESLPEQPDGIWSSAKSFLSEVFTAEWMFLIVSLMLEIFSAICDQLSSLRKPLYALFGMGLAIMALATCIWEFIHKGRRGKVEFGKCGKLLWWFYCPCSGTLFGTFPEICGLIYAITQWASSMVQLVCVLRHKDNPFKVNILPVLFLVCLVVSKLIRNARGRTREETSETELESIAVDP